jgi:hypothetical protein
MLTYDKNNALARESLSALLSTGLFMLQDIPKEPVDIDGLSGLKPNGKEQIALDNYMREAKHRIPSRNMSLDEAYQVVIREVRSLYDMKDAV